MFLAGAFLSCQKSSPFDKKGLCPDVVVKNVLFLCLPSPVMLIDFQLESVQPLSKSVDFASAVISVFVFLQQKCYPSQHLLGFFVFWCCNDFFVFRSHVPLPEATTMWTRWGVPYFLICSLISPMLPP